MRINENYSAEICINAFVSLGYTNDEGQNKFEPCFVDDKRFSVRIPVEDEEKAKKYVQDKLKEISEILNPKQDEKQSV